ncbi:acetoacetyl-CoA synthetase-like [Biomphalaria glabrata]|uniref:Acetoacetyl-CoA synthetase n=1 Tax=Biomphalaria glabrata TaxID=6526 RepID=A0A9U8DWR1_BIOGL|nr:acetoacetyl-CoA synthetase-like [Biomphalaria glabrata]XP_055862625.1 acetoacetyl-CoA synthetase-like [Biomphalaria glabrata]XP_055862626.1 acetoacetyl-CoA synthetase-like [Biomphalaria glabrata]XP_055862627.1 acetoacetyl-CoA synthetase-like [Biomphalaria glabrata]XP_055862629.1 acetoacetyl-CoA synthetase-like [Biomphalaria glabrata]
MITSESENSLTNSKDHDSTRKPQQMWAPKNDKITQMDKLRELINQKYGVQFNSYRDLHRWSCDNYPEFWGEVWAYADIIHSKPYDEVIDKKLNISAIPEWFKGSRLNFAENLLRYDDDKVAIYATGEGQNEIKQKTFRELRQSVAQFASAMKKYGVEKGDRVVGYIPNCMEAVECMLAASSIGAIWSSTSPDFGVVGVLERFTQIRPKLIFSVNAVNYNGKVHSHMEKLEQVVKGLPDLEKVVIIPFVTGRAVDLTIVPHSITLEEFLQAGLEKGQVPKLVFEQLPFNHPLVIMYSSGTTGVPKCMVHSAGGTLMKHLSEHLFHGNMDRSDIMLYYTTAGWMMWNWMVTALAVGSAIVLYDGSPLVPHPNILWDIVDKLGVTILGTGAKWLAVLEDKGVKPKGTHSLASLKAILSTGSPLKTQSFDYVYRDIKSNVLLGSISGGTDIIACFMGQNWTVPVYRGEIQCLLLGCDMQSWHETGKPVWNQDGELVCLTPFPSMPVYFWNDDDGTKYKKAYFNKFPNIWAHGDYCLINSETGGVLMLGRSDGTLNPNGVRFGSAEIYHVVESFKEIQDSVCVGQKSKDGSDERVVLFLKMAPGSEFGSTVVESIKNHIRTYLSARHVPAVILPIADIPYTISGKKVEVAIKQALSGQEVLQRGALANPDCLDLYYNIPELQGY